MAESKSKFVHTIMLTGLNNFTHCSTFILFYHCNVLEQLSTFYGDGLTCYVER